MYGFGKTRGGKFSITTQGDRSQVVSEYQGTALKSEMRMGGEVRADK